MRVGVQWTQSTPKDWEFIDSQDWASTPKLPEPPTHQIVGMAKGWPYRLVVQGVEFTAEHYAVEHISDEEIRVTVWNDSDDYPDGEKFAQVWTIRTLAPDARLNGAYNTRQTQVIYAQAAVRARFPDEVENTTFEAWSAFVPPASAITRHGVWVSDDANESHNKARALCTWHEWTEGLPAEEIRDGKLHMRKQQARILGRTV